MKTCSRCKAEKPPTDFGKRKAAVDGLHPYCKLCVSAYTKADYEKNREIIVQRNKEYRVRNAGKVRETKKAYVASNRERIAEKNRAYYEQNRERLLEKQRSYWVENADKRKQYEQSNRHIYAAKAARRRAREAAQTIPLTREQQDAIKHIYGFARYLTGKFGKPYHVDHIMPLKGKTSRGLHVPWNLQILPASKNLAKGNKESF